MANQINPDGYGFGLLPGSSSPFWRGDETPPIGALADVQTAGAKDQFVLLYDILSRTWIAKPLIDDTQSSDYTTYSARKIEELIANIEGGGGGTNDYDHLINKPAVNGITLSGDKSLDDFGIQGKLTAVGYISIDNMNRISVNIPIDDAATDAEHLWSAEKIANMLSTKANINAFENYYTKTQMDTVLDSKVDETEFNELEDTVDTIKYYSGLLGKPSINGHELLGNKTSQELGIVDNHEIVLPATAYATTQFLTSDKLGTGICIVDATAGSDTLKFVGAYNITDLNGDYAHAHLFRQNDLGHSNNENLEMQLAIKGSALFPASSVGSISTVRVRSTDNVMTYNRDSFVINNVQFIPMAGGQVIDTTLKHTQYVKNAAELGISLGTLYRFSGQTLDVYATINVDGLTLDVKSGEYTLTMNNGKRYFTKVSSYYNGYEWVAAIDIYGDEELSATPTTLSLELTSVPVRSYSNDYSSAPVEITGLDTTKNNHYILLSIMNTEYINVDTGATTPNGAQYRAILHLITDNSGYVQFDEIIPYGNDMKYIITISGFDSSTGTYHIDEMSTSIKSEVTKGVLAVKMDADTISYGIISEF